MARQGVTRGSTTETSRAEDAAVAAFTTHLADPEIAAVTYAQLAAAHERHRLMVGGRQLCTVLRPRFLAKIRLAHLARMSEIVARVLERAGRGLLASDRLLDLVGASDAEREIWSVDPGYDGFTLTSRLDSFMVGDRVRFVEYNAESPAGIGFCDLLAEVFNDLAAVRRWRGARAPEQGNGRRQLLDALLWAYHRSGRRGVPSVAVIDWEDVLTRRDFELCAQFFRAQGVPTVILDPRALSYRNGRVWAGSEEITLVYRRVLLHELLDKADDVQPLLRAYREGAVCMVNSPRSKLLHKKSVLALLSDGRLPVALTAEERDVVDQAVPWTRLAVPGATAYQGQTVDLATLLETGQERFAIKPIDDYGGRGVVLGWDVPADTWCRTIEQSLDGGYVVQERVDVPAESFPVWRDGRVEWVPLWLDTDPLLFRGAVGGVLTRLSGSALLNVSAGAGSAAATFVVDEKEA